MVLEIELKPESVTNLERFLNTNTYKELAESTMSFNRKLNEERKMRIPYIDGQTGVAQKHYDNQRNARERMPGRRRGQVYTYPQVSLEHLIIQTVCICCFYKSFLVKYPQKNVNFL